MERYVEEMISLKQYLEEGREGSLFHGTRASFAELILDDKQITGKTYHKLKNQKFNKRLRGVSLTRNIKFAIQMVFHESNADTCIVFELDQRKLAQRHKIMPINYYTTTYPIENGELPDGYTGARKKDDRMYTGEANNESEEFVIGDIKRIENYIIKIHVCSDLTKEHVDTKYPLLWKHPKLWYAERNNERGYFYNA